MQIINKIGILINWPREFDMYQELIKHIPNNKIELIINDVSSIEKGRSSQAEIIKSILTKKDLSYKLFSNIYKKKSFKVLISTGEVSSQKISFYSIVRFLFAHTLGLFLEITRISKLLMLYLKKPYTAGGLNCTLGMNWYPEKTLGKIIIKFPDGMDLKLRKYPYDEYKKIFDIYFVHGKFEQKLVQKKFSSKPTHIIGYPRYSNLKDEKFLKGSIEKDFNLDKQKKLIYWTPTNVDNHGEKFSNILLWINKISKLQNEYNIIIRPHPKSLMLEPNLELSLREKNFFIDKDQNRKIGEIFQISDLIISDYGGTVFSAIFFCKPIILLNLSHNSKFVSELKYLDSLDLRVRKLLLNLDTISTTEDIVRAVNKSKSSEYKRIIVDYKKDFFGSKDETKVDLTKDFLLNLLSK